MYIKGNNAKTTDKDNKEQHNRICTVLSEAFFSSFKVYINQPTSSPGLSRRLQGRRPGEDVVYQQMKINILTRMLIPRDTKGSSSK